MKAITGHKHRNDEWLVGCLKSGNIFKRLLPLMTPKGKDPHSFGCSLCHPWISWLFEAIQIYVCRMVFAKRLIC